MLATYSISLRRLVALAVSFPLLNLATGCRAFRFPIFDALPVGLNNSIMPHEWIDHGSSRR